MLYFLTSIYKIIIYRIFYFVFLKYYTITFPRADILEHLKTWENGRREERFRYHMESASVLIKMAHSFQQLLLKLLFQFFVYIVIPEILLAVPPAIFWIKIFLTEVLKINRLYYFKITDFMNRLRMYFISQNTCRLLEKFNSKFRVPIYFSN